MLYILTEEKLFQNIIPNMIHLMKKYWTPLKNINQIYPLTLKYFVENCVRGKSYVKKKSKKQIFLFMFPNIECLLKILCIIPVTTATTERPFSLLKQIKKYSGYTTNVNRLNGLASLRINKDIDIIPKEALDIFSKKS